MAGSPDGDRVAARRRHPGLLVWAAALRRAAAVRLLLALGWDVDARGRQDMPDAGEWETALHAAAGNGDDDLVRAVARGRC